MPPPDDYGDDVDGINLRVDAAWDMAPVWYRSLTVRTSRYRCSLRQSVDQAAVEPLAQKLAAASMELSAEINNEILGAIGH
jgi:hypothetical protein